MNILITGAFGGVGSAVLDEALKKGHSVIIFELPSKVNLKRAKRYEAKVESLIWGDLSLKEGIQNALKKVDVVIHLAGIIPPMSERNPTLSHKVNVIGTQNLINAIEEKESQDKLIFTSSVSVMGYTNHKKPPVKITDPVQATSHYTEQKIACEMMLRDSKIHWVIARLGAVMNTKRLSGGGSMKIMAEELFRMPLDARIEIVIDLDLAKALVSAAEIAHHSQDIDKKTFFIGGGERNGCRLVAKDFLTQLLNASGIGMFSERYFSTEPYFIDWLDTDESQQWLQFQQHSFNDYLNITKKKLGFRRLFIKLLAPMIRWRIGKLSPYVR